MTKRRSPVNSDLYLPMRLGVLSLASSIILGSTATAQILPDDTLGAETSTVRQDNIQGLPSNVIEGGATRGANLFHSFSEFNIEQGRGAYFANPEGIANILSRVTGSNASKILGTLGVLGNANLFFINPNGIVFGSNVSLDLKGSFVGSTADSLVFENGFEFSASNPQVPPLLRVNIPIGLGFRDNQTGILVNTGNLEVGQQHNLTLLGGTVISTGQLYAPGGNVSLAAIPEASLVRLGEAGQLQSWEASLTSDNRDTKTSNLSLLELLSQVGDDLGLEVTSEEQVKLGESGMSLTVTPGTTVVSGTLDASNIEQGQTGGQVVVLGDRVGLLDGAQIDVSGNSGGGTVLIGGDFQGNGEVPNASYTFVSSGSIIKADALDSGNGGRIIVWGDKGSRFYGTINARGGINSGNGGFVEVSSPQVLDFRGKVDTRAPHGETGTLILDPTNIEVVEFLDAETSDLNEVDEFSAPDIGDDENTKIDALAIALASSNVILQATNDITFNTDVLLFTPNVGITAQAGNNIVVNNSIFTDGGVVELKAGKDISLNGSFGLFSNITTNGAEVLLRAEGNLFLNDGAVIDTSTLSGNGGQVQLIAEGDISLTGTELSEEFSNIATNGADVSLRAEGNIFLNDGAVIDTSTLSGDGGQVQLMGKGDISFTRSFVFSGGGNVLLSTEDNLNPRGNISLTDRAGITTSNIFGGNSGEINIKTNSLFLNDRASIYSGNIFGNGNSGNISVEAKETISLSGESLIGSGIGAGAIGTGGKINIQTESLSLSSGSQISSILEREDSLLGLPAAQGQSGNIQVNATDFVDISGTDINGFSSGLLTSSERGANGAAGNITVNTNVFRVADGAVVNSFTANSGNAGNITINATTFEAVGGGQVLALTRDGGDAGTITINATDSITLSGIDPTFFDRFNRFGPDIVNNVNSFSGIFSDVDVSSTGNGGRLFLDTTKLVVTDGATASASTLGIGDAGILTIQTSESVEVSKGSKLTTFVGSEATGNGGNLTIDTGQLVVRNGGIISADTFGEGRGGNFTVTASESVKVIGGESGSAIFVGTEGSKPAGKLKITTGQLIIQDNALVSTATSGAGKAGDLTIRASDSVAVSKGSSLSTIVVNSEATGDGGKLSIETEKLVVQDRGQVTASTLGIGKAGDLTIQASDSVAVSKGSSLSTIVNSEATGNGGKLTIETEKLVVQDANSAVLTSTFGAGKAGDLTIRASDSVQVSRDSLISAAVNETATGDGGNFTIETERLVVQDGGIMSVATLGDGKGGKLTVSAAESVDVIGTQSSSGIVADTTGSQPAGNITITTGRFNIQNNAVVSTGTFGAGEAGNLTIYAADSVNVSGSSSRLLTTVSEEATGKGGDLTITTGKLTVDNSAIIASGTFGDGQSGKLTIKAIDSIELTGNGSGLFTQTEGNGNSNDLTIQTRNLIVNDGARISASTFGIGEAGQINVTADTFESTGGGAIQSITDSIGQAGDIILNIRDSLDLIDSSIEASTTSKSSGNGGSIIIAPVSVNLNDNAAIAVNSEGTGDGGNISLTAKDLTLNNNSEISAATASGEGGNIELAIADILLLDKNSPITAEADGTGNGGNIKISADFTILKESDITANAFEGQGGNIDITTQGLFLSPDSEITASSQLGVDGIVEINTPENDPSRGLVDLPENVVNPEDLISQNACKQGGQSKFTRTGRGGLPSTPEQVHHSDEVEVGLVKPAMGVAAINNELPVSERKRKIVPAKGWIRNQQGEVILVDYDPTASNISPQPENLDLCQPR